MKELFKVVMSCTKLSELHCCEEKTCAQGPSEP